MELDVHLLMTVLATITALSHDRMVSMAPPNHQMPNLDRSCLCRDEWGVELQDECFLELESRLGLDAPAPAHLPPASVPRAPSPAPSAPTQLPALSQAPALPPGCSDWAEVI